LSQKREKREETKEIKVLKRKVIFPGMKRGNFSVKELPSNPIHGRKKTPITFKRRGENWSYAKEA